MRQSISLSRIREITVTDNDGIAHVLTPQQAQELMEQANGGSGGINVNQLADGANAITGLMVYSQNGRYRDDEARARKKLKAANQKYIDELRKLPNGLELAKHFIDRCAAQDELDRAQDLINRSEDMAILVNSGGSAAKALLGERSAAMGGSAMGTREFLIGGAALWLGSRILDDGGRRRRGYDNDDYDYDYLGESTVPK